MPILGNRSTTDSTNLIPRTSSSKGLSLRRVVLAGTKVSKIRKSVTGPLPVDTTAY
jgi:hypothetical protein